MKIVFELLELSAIVLMTFVVLLGGSLGFFVLLGMVFS